MKITRIIELGFLHAFGAVAYIALVAVVMTRGEDLVNAFEGSLLPPILFLTLFVLSAAVMGLTLFGRPILWFLEGKKKEALMLALCTVLLLALIVASILLFTLAFGGEAFGTRL
ncbi:hypothetical protein K2P56_01740 [Patescibacteria group bacterium]|nr:hypothetical protein [Patescibacteria group bacterium]